MRECGILHGRGYSTRDILDSGLRAYGYCKPMIEIFFTGKLCTINQKYNKNFSLTDNYRIFKFLLSEQAKKDARKAKHIVYPKDALLYCSIDFSYNREKDIDSIVKPVLDSLQGIIYENDKSIKRLFIEKHKSSTKTEQVSIRIDTY